MIFSALRERLSRRAGTDGSGVTARRKSRKRAVIIGVVLAFLLVVRPEPALAICPVGSVCGPVACMFTCDAPTVASCVLSTTLAWGLLPAWFTLQLQPLQRGVADAVTALGVKVGGRVDALRGQRKEIAEAQAQTSMFTQQVAAKKKVDIATAVNPNSGQCRLDTVKSGTKIIGNFERAVVKETDRAGAALATGGQSTQRMRMASLQRLCKNGMLTPKMMGAKAFATLQCFEDPMYSGAHVNPQSVLGHMVLVPPNDVDMGILDNPDDPLNPVTALVVWDRLFDKQKDYVAAMRYCQTLEQSVLQTNTFTSDQASTPENMRRITQNFSATGMLQTLTNVCYAEVARRTAPNVYDAADPAMASPAMVKKREIDPRIVEQLKYVSLPVRTWQGYDGPSTLYDPVQMVPTGPVRTDAVSGGPQVFISPALYQYAKYYAYCSNPKTAENFDIDSGEEAVAYENHLKCETITKAAKAIDARYLELFSLATSGVQAIQGSFASPDPTAAKSAEIDGAGALQQVSLQKGGDKKTKVVPMANLIRKMDRETGTSLNAAR